MVDHYQEVKRKINIKCTSKRTNGKHKIASKELAYFIARERERESGRKTKAWKWQERMNKMELCVLAKKRSSKSTTTKINVICKRARVPKINQQKYPKTLKEYENKLLKPLPAVSVRSFTLGWSVYVRQSGQTNESIQEMKVLYV